MSFIHISLLENTLLSQGRMSYNNDDSDEGLEHLTNFLLYNDQLEKLILFLFYIVVWVRSSLSKEKWQGVIGL